MHLMTADPDFDHIWGQPTGQPYEISSGMLMSISLVAPYSAKVSTVPIITSYTTTLKCTWWLLTPILTIYEVSQLGNRPKSVQKFLLMSISLVAPYSAKVPINPKINSQTSFLKCTWWPLTPILTLYEVSQLGNRAKSVQECLWISISLVATYAAKAPTNPKITSHTTSLLLQITHNPLIMKALWSLQHSGTYLA